MSDRAPSQGAEANAEVPAGRFRSSARGLARAMRSVPGSVVLSFIILIAVAVCVFFSGGDSRSYFWNRQSRT